MNSHTSPRLFSLTSHSLVFASQVSESFFLGTTQAMVGFFQMDWMESENPQNKQRVSSKSDEIWGGGMVPYWYELRLLGYHLSGKHPFWTGAQSVMSCERASPCVTSIIAQIHHLHSWCIFHCHKDFNSGFWNPKHSIRQGTKRRSPWTRRSLHPWAPPSSPPMTPSQAHAGDTTLEMSTKELSLASWKFMELYESIMLDHMH